MSFKDLHRGGYQEIEVGEKRRRVNSEVVVSGDTSGVSDGTTTVRTRTHRRERGRCVSGFTRRT